MFLVPVSRNARPFYRLFDDTFDRVFGSLGTPETAATCSPALDVAETDRAYTVKLEVPGVDKDEVKVSVHGRQVTVQAQSQRGADVQEGERIVYRERTAPAYARTFRLPVEVDQAEAGAKLEHGVLTLTLPKRGARNAAQIAVS
jgi:HSP20 family protein